jgi:hypothetical protein
LPDLSVKDSSAKRNSSAVPKKSSKKAIDKHAQESSDNDNFPVIHKKKSSKKAVEKYARESSENDSFSSGSKQKKSYKKTIDWCEQETPSKQSSMTNLPQRKNSASSFFKKPSDRYEYSNAKATINSTVQVRSAFSIIHFDMFRRMFTARESNSQPIWSLRSPMVKRRTSNCVATCQIIR